MISDDELEQLRHKGESVDLDFKQAHYPFVGASDHQKSELLKDIMAMANAYRSGPAYILIGFEDKAPHPAEVVGISAGEHIDDATLQQFVHSKIDPLLEFHYEERLFAGKHVAVITIPKQVRPFAPKKDFGILRKNVALVRRGSSTDEVSLYEMTKMTLADAGASKKASVDLRIDSDDNEPLPEQMELTFLRFGDLPDYEEESYIELGNGYRAPMPSTRIVNRDYYQEAAEYHSIFNRLLPVRLSLANHSEFALEEVKLELSCSAPSGESIELRRYDDLPDEPTSGYEIYRAGAFRTMSERLHETVSVDERAREPVCHVLLGTLRPGEVGNAETDIALLPSGPGNYKLRVRILAKEISTPIVKEHAISFDGQVRQLELEDLELLLFENRADKLKQVRLAYLGSQRDALPCRELV